MSRLTSPLASLAVVLGGQCALGARIYEHDFHANAVSTESWARSGGMQDMNMICGGPEMWNLLTNAADSVTGVQNIKWAKMAAHQEAYIDTQSHKVRELEVELESLARLIAEKQAQRQIRYMHPDDAKKLIETAVGAGSFEGMQTAKDSGCGSVGNRVRAPRGAYRKSVPLFDAAASAFFSGKDFRLDSEDFLEVCNGLLPQEGRSYCKNLCQEFKDSAQAQSDEHVGETAGDLDALLRTQEEKTKALGAAKTQIADCTKSWDGLSVLRTHIEGLKGDMKTRFGILQDAEMDLDDAQWELSEMEENLKATEQVLGEALTAVKSSGDKHGKAGASLETLLAKEKAVLAEISAMADPLSKVHADFEAVGVADKTVVDLKSAVSATMTKMQLLTDAAVAEPLKNIGFYEELELDDEFTTDPVATQEGGFLGGAVDSLHSFCEDKALPAFSVVKKQVDLDPLCALDETPKVMQGLGEQVNIRINNIKKDLLWVKHSLSPYNPSRKHPMTKELAAEKVAAGEPKGFQEILKVFHGTTFFRSYLKDWRLGGPFLKLIAQLTTVKENLDRKIQELEEKLAGLKAEYAALVAAREQAAVHLEEMAAKASLAAEEKATVDKSVQEMRSNAATLANKIADLEEAVRKAKAAWEAAGLKLVEAHKEGVAALPQQEESMLELREHRAEAKMLISLIERSIDHTERSYNEAQEQLEKLLQ
uniref:Uncharacterized protein n=1 Tax=Alexandrium andersonii TaxID=327968 RepID=A0A7S2F7F0_9DINO|mmetsp:Transcript_17579/g.39676  ORF Transcript_17579/g.39676 Transcript_17579/m.39676 type:complete len:707 (+) Transcript_17579:83-2203(+)